MKKEIKALLYEPGKDEPREVLVPNTLEALQGIVGGYIETLTIGFAVAIFNEEGRILNLPQTVSLFGHILRGNVLLVGYSDENFDDFEGVLVRGYKWKTI